LEKVLPQEIKEIQTMNYLRSNFGSDMLYILAHTEGGVADVRSPDYLRYIDSVDQRISTREYVLSVRSVADVVKERNGGVIPPTREEVERLFVESEELDSLTNQGKTFSILEVQTNVGASADAITQIVEAIRTDIDASEHLNPGVETQLTGFPAIDQATFQVIMSDFLVITFAAMAVVALVVWITFGSLSRGMLPMAIVMNALVWTMGLVGYLGLTITVVTMVAAAMIMGLGIDFGIHQVHGYFRLREDYGYSSKRAVKSIVQELIRAMIGASFTTMAGFLALLFGVLPAMQNLGLILAMGIFTTLIGAVFLLPVIIYLSDRNRTYGGVTQ
jgi:hypothetical protein